MDFTPLHPEWLDSIKDPGLYPHPVSNIRLLETHISWVILTGDWAYKLKKPVNFGFVDFSSIELRQAACLEEVRLNRRTAPLLYDAVIPLTAEIDGPHFGGSGPVIEYAVRMRQFDQEDLLDNCLSRHEMSAEFLDRLATAISDLHSHAAIASADSAYATPDVIRENVVRCLDHLESDSVPDELQTQRETLGQWVSEESKRLNSTFITRKREGWVRECHGDLHLGNLVRYRGEPTLFDCLEFSPILRWIDCISDIAFLMMDLCHTGEDAPGWRVLNEWLQQTGDFGGLAVLRYYFVYRALVRAKVAAIRLHQPELSLTEENQQKERLKSYVDLALQSTRPCQAAIILMHGVSGSGKSFVARQLAPLIQAIRIRSDVERKRLLGSAASPSRVSVSEADLYSPQAIHRTYQHLQTLARTVVAAGFPVIIDATFCKRTDRADFAAIAKELSVPFLIISCTAQEHVLLERVAQRTQCGNDASDANASVLKQQLKSADPLDAIEAADTIPFDTNSGRLSNVVELIFQRIRPRRTV